LTVSEQFGRNLRRARRRALLSQEGLARKTGLHHTEISLLERGLRVPRLDTSLKIVQAAESDPRELFDGITWHEPETLDEKGWFTVVGLFEPARLRPTNGRVSS
jgi:transcriptional regulator with XRE-family HTH domain